MTKPVEGIRWAFNFGTWNPTREQWLLANRCVQPEEKERIHRFVYKRDAKAAMAGRLLLRKMIQEKLGIDYPEILLERSDKGKPYLVNTLPAGNVNVSFNVSHQGAFSVLAAESFFRVGVDVMKVEYIGGKTVSEFFHTMRRQFTPKEWSSIREPPLEQDQLAQFYRHWCLKESYVKAVGVGIGFELQRLSFATQTKKLQQGVVTLDTSLKIEGIEAKDWLFEETMLDSDHCVCVALGKKPAYGELPQKGGTFEVVQFSDFLSSATAWREEDESTWECFVKMDEQPGVLKE